MHERSALVQACRQRAAWGVAEGQCPFHDAAALSCLQLGSFVQATQQDRRSGRRATGRRR